jgi:hypothetical protein
MLAVQDVLKAHRIKDKDGKLIKDKAGKSIGYPPKTITVYLSNIRKAIMAGTNVNHNGGKVSTILFAIGKKAEPSTMVTSLRNGFNKMKDNSDNAPMQRLAAFLIDALDEAEAA